MSRYVWDTEATNLLNSSSVDYTASPYKLKDDFKVHCVGFIDVDTKERHFFEQDECKRVKEFLLDTATELISHNGISYDHPVMKAYYGIDFDIGCYEGVRGEYYNKLRDRICNKPITITDTLMLSKTLNPDRVAHSIEYFGKIIGTEKIDWRAKAVELKLIPYDAPKGAEFLTYHPEMGVYMMRDCEVGEKVWRFLIKEWGEWDWREAYDLEKKVAEIIHRQEHRGFKFNEPLAKDCVRELDEKMESLRTIVEPLIPPKPITKTAAKDYIPPKIQFKKNGEVSALMQKWVEKQNGYLMEYPEGMYAVIDLDNTGLDVKKYKLPMPLEPIKTHIPATIKDTTHIKGWLVEMGWKPSAYKERDLTVDSKKHKLSKEKFEEAVDRYVEQTLSSPFKRDRLEHLEVTSVKLRSKLLAHDMKRPLKVYTNPTLTVGVEKEIDPALLDMKDKFAYAKEVSDFLTYSHRRNSILGGGFDPDDLDDDDEYATKGWLSQPRIEQDSRIPTPADTCGAGTSRFKHRICANIPRITSLYGGKMRALFGADVENGFYQLGYDFASLEAICEAHYCWKYDDEEKSYCNSLTQPKPLDVHTITAKKISDVIGRDFGRPPAKNVKYCCAYGGQPKRVAKTVGCSEEDGYKIYNAYWEAAKPLKLLADKLKAYWETTGNRKFIISIDGRKVPTRSASALVNSLFQSTGVICAKYAMILHDKKMKEEGLSVDFWMDDWKNSAFVQQMIAYHDESQLEVHKDLIRWKVFKTEEEAKSFKAANPSWSEVGHSDKGYYVGWCRAGEMLKEIMDETSNHFKLNVGLSADYIMGRHWAECH